MAVSERLTIGFLDPASGRQGVVISGAGSLLAADGQVRATGEAELGKDDGEVWRARAGGAFDVALEPLADPLALGGAAIVWMCAARGTIGGEAFEGVGHLTREGPPEGARLERSVTAWLGDERYLAMAARRPRRAHEHGDESLAAAILRGAPLHVVSVEQPRLSSTFDGDGRLLRCGVELWETADAEFAHRFGGLATASGELTHADGARTLVSFVAWRGDRDSGHGRYDLTQR